MYEVSSAAEKRKNEVDDSGLFVLEMFFRLRRIEASREQIRLQADGGILTVADLSRCARRFGLSARCVTFKWAQLARSPLPAIATLRTGGFLLLGAVADERAVILMHRAMRPAVVPRADFEALWDGGLVFMTKPAWVDARWLQFCGAMQFLKARIERIQMAGRPHLAERAADLSAKVARATIIDFADRARQIRRVAGSQLLDRGGGR